MKVTILDTETTGFSGRDVILSAAYITADARDMKILDSRVLYFYDEMNRCNLEALEIHHLTSEFLKRYEQDYNKNITNLFKVMHNGIIIGHNTAFDVRLVNQTLKQHGLYVKPYMTVCTMQGTTHLNNGKYFKLINLLKYLNIPEQLIEKKRNDIFGANPIGLDFHSADFDTTAVYLMLTLRPSIFKEFNNLK